MQGDITSRANLHIKPLLIIRQVAITMEASPPTREAREEASSEEGTRKYRPIKAEQGATQQDIMMERAMGRIMEGGITKKKSTKRWGTMWSKGGSGRRRKRGWRRRSTNSRSNPKGRE